MATAFEQLGPEVRRLLAASGLERPTAPQEAAIPRILAGQSVLVLAPTGAGKTEAALLPVLDQLAARQPRAGIGCLYVTPLRALNRDMERRIVLWAKELGLSCEVRHGDTPTNQRRKQAVKPPDLLVTTPETLQAILPAKVMRRHLGHVKWVIVDEVHQLAKDRRGVQLTVALERLAEVADFQRIALSATVGDPERVAAMFGGPEPLEVVRASPPKRMSYHVDWPKPNDGDFELSRELFISPEVASVLTTMRDEAEAHASTLVFVNSRLNAELLGSRFPMVMDGVAVHHGSLTREVRERAEADLKAGKLKALVATSTLELGIDVGKVDHAIQYQSPRQVASLIQRVGRAGHDLQRVSKGTIVCASADDALESLAIVARAEKGLVEPPRIHAGALDVLGHQLVGLALDEGGRITKARALEVLRRASTYRDLAPEAVEKVADFMLHLRHLRKEGAEFVAGARARDYYYKNLSTIRDERTYPVLDLSTMRPVGILGEEEMLLRVRKGVAIVLRGRTWRIHQVGPDGTVYVEPVVDPTARIPGWEGTLLPVPFEIAQETAAMREGIAERLRTRTIDEVVTELAKEWPVNRSAVRRVVEQVQEHLASGAPMPGPKRVVVEAFDRYLVLHVPFGDLVNDTLTDILEELLARKHLVRFWWFDPYRAMLELTVDTRDLEVEKLARELLVHTQAEVEDLLGVFTKDHLPIGYYMKPVAERLGALPRGLWLGTDETNSLEVRFKGTPVEDEAMREVLLDHTDFPRVREVFAGLREGCIELVVHRAEKPSPLAYHIVRRYLEVPEHMSPEADREASVQRMRQFLQTERVNLLCFGCGHFAAQLSVGALPDRPSCEQCRAPVLGVLGWHGRPVQDALAKHRAGAELSDEERKELTRTRQGADMVAVYGRKAVLALSVYGVGPQAAAKILAKMHRDEGAFYRDLYEAKLKFVMTRPYWDKPGREPASKPNAYSQREGASTERRI